MAELIAKPAFEGLLPLDFPGVRAAPWDCGPITSVAPFRGRHDAVSAALKAATGCPLPGVGGVEGAGTVRVLWAGLDQWFVTGARPEGVTGAALTDQTDAWAGAVLSGPLARDVLARLTPMDLRPQVFGAGQSARTLLGHMAAVVVALDAESFGLLVFRSMAGTAAHEMERAMRMVAARDALGSGSE